MALAIDRLVDARGSRPAAPARERAGQLAVDLGISFSAVADEDEPSSGNRRTKRSIRVPFETSGVSIRSQLPGSFKRKRFSDQDPGGEAMPGSERFQIEIELAGEFER